MFYLCVRITGVSEDERPLTRMKRHSPGPSLCDSAAISSAPGKKKKKNTASLHRN